MSLGLPEVIPGAVYRRDIISRVAVIKCLQLETNVYSQKQMGKMFAYLQTLELESLTRL